MVNGQVFNLDLQFIYYLFTRIYWGKLILFYNSLNEQTPIKILGFHSMRNNFTIQSKIYITFVSTTEYFHFIISTSIIK